MAISENSRKENYNFLHQNVFYLFTNFFPQLATKLNVFSCEVTVTQDFLQSSIQHRSLRYLLLQLKNFMYVVSKHTSFIKEWSYFIIFLIKYSKLFFSLDYYRRRDFLGKSSNDENFRETMFVATLQVW